MEFVIKLLTIIILLDSEVLGWLTCPKSCDCTKKSVDCSHRGIKEFPTYFPSNVENLNFSGNEIHYLPDVLYNLQNLAHLNLGWNQLNFVQETTLQRLWKLETLDLSGNRFRRLTDIRGIYHSYKLKELDVHNNPIKETGSCTPDDAIYSESVYKLDLSKCVLTNINPCAFLWLSNLTHLHLSGNPIQQLTQIISESIEYLDLSNCDIHYVTTQAFDKLPSLKYLDLSQNANLKIHTPFNNAYMSESLLSLDVSNCGLTELIISEFPNLKFTTFKGNFIRELPNRLLYHNRELIKLDLSENLITSINSATFTGADSLKYLDLSSNFINDFHPGTFLHLFNLQNLNISRNPLRSLSNISTTSLQNLDASDCDITELTTLTFLNIPDLLSLNLSNNPIEYLPKELNLERLVELDLSYCRITTINNLTFKNLISLRKLDLRGNRLTNIFHRLTMESLINIKEILITNNPWHCGCNTSNHEEFLKFVMKRSPKIDQQDLTCLVPDSQLHVLWMKACQIRDEKEITNKKFRPERHWTAFIVTFSIMSTLIFILLYLRHNLSITPDVSSSDNVDNNNVSSDTDVTPYPVRSPISDILQLPTYEEAILLPKPTNLNINSSTFTITRDIATWTSDQSLNNDDVDGHGDYVEDDDINSYNGGENGDTEISSLCRPDVNINVSSTSL